MDKQEKNIDLEYYKGLIEALIFASGEGLSLSVIEEATQLSNEVIREVLEEMRLEYQNKNRGLILIQMENTWQLGTKPELYNVLKGSLGRRQSQTLSKAALETLAIIAYKQPVTRIEIEGLRGVASNSSIQVLLDRGLVKESGKKDVPGKPYLYRTTLEFLKAAQIHSLSELPSIETFAQDVNLKTEEIDL